MSRLNEFGQEVPDETPVVIRLKSRRITDFDQVREFIRQELSRSAQDSGMETLEEANDFDVDGDLFPVSAHEYEADTEASDLEALRLGDPRNPSRQPSVVEGSPGGASSDAGVQPASAPPAPSAGNSVD